MVTTRSAAAREAARPPAKSQNEKQTKVTKSTKTKSKKTEKITETSDTDEVTPEVPEITITSAASGSRNNNTSQSPGRRHMVYRPPTPPLPRAPRTPSPPARPAYKIPKRRRSSQTEAERKRNAIKFYKILLPVSHVMMRTFADYDGQKEMFKVWHLTEETLARLAKLTGNWNLETVSPGVPLNEDGEPESPAQMLRGRRKYKFKLPVMVPKRLKGASTAKQTEAVPPPPRKRGRPRKVTPDGPSPPTRRRGRPPKATTTTKALKAKVETAKVERPRRKNRSPPSNDHAPQANAVRDKATVQGLYDELQAFRARLTKIELGKGLIENDRFADVLFFTRKAIKTLGGMAEDL